MSESSTVLGIQESEGGRMTLDEAKAILSDTTREVLSDHAFSDEEVYWMRNDEEVAVGYFGLDAREVTISDTKFTGDDAMALRFLGKTGRVTRNDSQEPALGLEDLTERELVEAGMSPGWSRHERFETDCESTEDWSEAYNEDLYSEDDID